MNLRLLFLLVLASPAIAQTSPVLTRADSQLVARVLSAEDRRDSADWALTLALPSVDARIRTIAWRATQRMQDSSFAQRAQLPPLPAPPVWPEPDWRSRYRAVAPHRSD